MAQVTCLIINISVLAPDYSRLMRNVRQSYAITCIIVYKTLITKVRELREVFIGFELLQQLCGNFGPHITSQKLLHINTSGLSSFCVYSQVPRLSWASYCKQQKAGGGGREEGRGLGSRPYTAPLNEIITISQNCTYSFLL